MAITFEEAKANALQHLEKAHAMLTAAISEVECAYKVKFNARIPFAQVLQCLNELTILRAKISEEISRLK